MCNWPRYPGTGEIPEDAETGSHLWADSSNGSNGSTPRAARVSEAAWVVLTSGADWTPRRALATLVLYPTVFTNCRAAHAVMTRIFTTLWAMSNTQRWSQGNPYRLQNFPAVPLTTQPALSHENRKRRAAAFCSTAGTEKGGITHVTF